MAILFRSHMDRSDLWQDAFAKLAPSLDFRVYPAVGAKEEIDYALVWFPETGLLKSLPNLKIIFSLGAGIDHILLDGELPRDKPIVRMVDRGLSVTMTEYVVYGVLRFHRQMPEFEAAQRAHRWHFLDSPAAWDRRVGILGLGVLGSAAAVQLKSLGFQVSGWSRRTKTMAGITSFAGADALAPFLAQTDILVCLLPGTKETEGIVNARTLALMPRGAFFINAARGRHVVEADLLAALDSGQLGGVLLDVFRDEPLAPGSRFWDHPKVTVTPHVAGLSMPITGAELVLENIRRYRAGEPMLNVVDLAAGY